MSGILSEVTNRPNSAGGSGTPGGSSGDPQINDGAGGFGGQNPLSIAVGGTNSQTALNNNRVMQSTGGKIQEAAAITASRALASDANGIPVAVTTTTTELNYVNGVTSAIQTQMNLKAPLASPTFTGTVTTPVTASRFVVTDGSSALAANAALTANRAVVSTAAGGVATPGEIDAGNSGTAVTIDFASGPAQKTTLTGNPTITLSNMSAGQGYILRTIGDGTARTVTYSPVPKWGSAGAPTPTGTSGHWDILGFYYDGTNVTGFYRQDIS